MAENNHMVIIDEKPLSVWSYTKHVFKNRFLILTFAERDLKIKYAQTFLGIGWSVLQPVITLIIYYFFFGFVLKMNTGKVPYLVFTFSGITAWNFFNYIVYQASTVLIEKQDIMRKLSFPRFTLLFSKVIVAGVELVISLIILFALLLLYGVTISKWIFLLPVAIILSAVVGLSFAVWISVLSIKHRDIIHAIPYLINLGIWLTPVFYPITFLPDSLSFLHYVNPVAGAVEFTRFCIIADYQLNFYQLASCMCTIPVFISGFFYFKNSEKEMMNYF